MSSYSDSLPTFTTLRPNLVPAPEGLGLTGIVENMKSYLSISLYSTFMDNPGYQFVSLAVSVDTSVTGTTSFGTKVNSAFSKVTGQANIIVGPPSNTPQHGYVGYSHFVSGQLYYVRVTIVIRNINAPTSTQDTAYQSVYEFKYVNPVPTLNNFTFESNVASGDNIKISGLTIVNPSPFPGDIPLDISFRFNELEITDASGNPVVITDASGNLINDNNNNEVDQGYNPVLPYDPSGNYVLPGIDVENHVDYFLPNNEFFQVTATANWASGYSTEVDAGQRLYVIARPIIDSVEGYDAHNDGGQDGVGDDEDGNDASNQIIATIVLGDAGYGVNFEPEKVVFIFYDLSDNEIGKTKEYDYSSEGSYSVELLSGGELKNTANPLLNGVKYNVKAQVKVPIVIGGVTLETQTRTSDEKSVIFKQGVAPVLSLTSGNTWMMVCNNNPSSDAAKFNLSPLLGISGHFKKNDQFASGYSKNLDTSSTKFLLQYKIGDGDLTNVVRAALIQRGSEAIEQTMVDAMATLSIKNGVNGKFNNVVGPSNTRGSQQNQLVFYIPNVQGDDTFAEPNNVTISVTIVDEANLWLDPSDNTIDNVSLDVTNNVIMVNKIPTYSYTSANAGSPIEPFIANVDISYNLVSVLNNNVLSTVNETNIIADSADIITQTARGWTVVNPAAIGTPPKFPKVNLYYYNKDMSEDFTMGQVNQSSDLGMWCVINQNTNAKLYPFFIAYTQTTASGNAASWYKSKILYSPLASSNAAQPGLTLLYTGVDDGSLYAGDIPTSRRVRLVLDAAYSAPSVPNANLSTEVVNLVSIGTPSNVSETNAGDFDFTLLYAGVIRNGSYTTTLFTDPLLKVNIPVDNSFSSYFNSSIVNNLNTPSGGFVIENSSSTSTSMFVLPVLTQSKYNVQYSIKNPNNNNAIVKGLVSADSTVSTLNEPQLTDFTVANFGYKTVNSVDAKSSIVFDLTLAPYDLDRIDGVHVYFTSDSNSSINKVKIGTFKASQSVEINLLNTNSNTLAFGNNLTWNPYTSATITFVPFRDNRVDSASAKDENVFATWTAPTVWNIPKIDKPSVSGDITLTGGVVNSSDNTVIEWVNDTGAAYSYPVSFSYTLTMAQDSGSDTPVTTVTTDGSAASAILSIAANSTNAYSLVLKKVFQGQSSEADTITFNSVKVNTSVMDISVLNPSNLTSVKVSWVDLAIGISGADSSFTNNVASLCMTDNGTRLDNSVNAATIETSNRSYSLTQPVGTTLKLQLKVTAWVQYFVNDDDSVNSSAVSLPLSPFTKYTISTIPIVSLSSAGSTVLIPNSTAPSLLLNLNANGLEEEGFISIVVILTQDGTDVKPAGQEVLLQFPSPPAYSSPYSFPNILNNPGNTTTSLVGGESSTVAPLGQFGTHVFDTTNQYTLNIGSAGASGRYGLSSLTFPTVSGFVNGQESNVMVVLTSRRGTDIMVGSFTFVTPPVASNVSVSTQNGTYVLTFTVG
jgi:hypothetical protein